MRSEQEETAFRAIGPELGRELSGRSVMLHAAVSERFGLNATDHKALDLLLRRGAMTAGQMAEETGLTSGAITGMIDRLEKAGFARRERDESDRRVVRIYAVEEKCAPLIAMFEPLRQAMTDMALEFTSEEREVVHRYFLRAIEILAEQTQLIREDALHQSSSSSESGGGEL